MKDHLSFGILTLVFASFAVSSSAEVNELQFNSGNFKIRWKYLPETQEIEFKLRVKSTGYVALGITEINSGMEELDLFVGGFDSYSNKAYLEDRYSTSLSSPTLDGQQDYTLISASQSNGITEVHCKRKLLTHDNDDFQIQAGDKVYFAWATHVKKDFLRYHTQRGYSSEMYVLVPIAPKTTQSPSSSTTQFAPTRSASLVKRLQFNGGNFNVSWSYLSASQEIEFEVSVKSTGYVALGLTKSNFGMRGLDLFMGGFMVTPYLKDQHVNGYQAPSPDFQQNYNLISASESNGITKVHCKRKLLTNDENDFQIKAGDKVYFAWATHYRNDYLSYHTSRGYSSQMYELVPGLAPLTTPPIPPSIVYDSEMAFKTGDFLLFWKFDSSTEELFFKLKVKTTGYVGLGFSNKNFYMAEMDVVIAGVSGGQGYIGDYYSYQLTVPVRDTSQDYTLISATESGGTTTVEFKRKINTGDNKDLQIKPGSSYYIAWAYHVFSDILIYHSGRGYSQQKVVLVDAGKSSPLITSFTSTKEPIQITSSYTKPTQPSSYTTTKEKQPVIHHTSTELSQTTSSYTSTKEKVPLQIHHTLTKPSQTTSSYTSTKEKVPLQIHHTLTEPSQTTSSYTSTKEKVPLQIHHTLTEPSQTTSSYTSTKDKVPSQIHHTLTEPSQTTSSYTSTKAKEPVQIHHTPTKPSQTTSSYTPPTKAKEPLQIHQTPTQPSTTSSFTTKEPSQKTSPTIMSPNTGISSTKPTPPLQETTSAAATTSPSIPKLAATSTELPTPTTSTVGIAYENKLNFNNGDFLFFWKFDNNTKDLLCKLEVKATGWVGFGFSDVAYWMTSMDVMIAGVREGKGYIGDYFADGETIPSIDTQQDFILISAVENEGKTTIEFKRKIDTDDSYDHMIMPGVPYYVSWACHITSDKVDYYGYHGNCRGYSPRKVVLVPTGNTETPLAPATLTITSTVTETKTTTETTTVTKTVIMPTTVTKATTLTVTVTVCNS